MEEKKTLISLCPYLFELIYIKCYKCHEILKTYTDTGKNNLPWCDYICLNCNIIYELKTHYNHNYIENKKKCNKYAFVGGNIVTFEKLEEKPCLIILNYHIHIINNFLNIIISSIRYYKSNNYTVIKSDTLKNKTNIYIKVNEFDYTYDYDKYFNEVCSFKILTKNLNNIKLNDFTKIQKIGKCFENIYFLNLSNGIEKNNFYFYAQDNKNYFDLKILIDLCFCEIFENNYYDEIKENISITSNIENKKYKNNCFDFFKKLFNFK